MTALGIVIFRKFWHPANANSPMLVTLSGNVMSVRLLQSLNIYFPMLVMLSGSVTFFNFVQPPNALLSIVVRFSSMVMLVTLSQSANAESPMILTFFGIIMLVRLLQRKNALPTINVTLEPISREITLLRFWFHPFSSLFQFATPLFELTHNLPFPSSTQSVPEAISADFTFTTSSECRITSLLSSLNPTTVHTSPVGSEIETVSSKL